MTTRPLDQAFELVHRLISSMHDLLQFYAQQDCGKPLGLGGNAFSLTAGMVEIIDGLRHPRADARRAHQIL